MNLGKKVMEKCICEKTDAFSCKYCELRICEDCGKKCSKCGKAFVCSRICIAGNDIEACCYQCEEMCCGCIAIDHQCPNDPYKVVIQISLKGKVKTVEGYSRSVGAYNMDKMETWLAETTQWKGYTQHEFTMKDEKENTSEFLLIYNNIEQAHLPKNEKASKLFQGEYKGEIYIFAADGGGLKKEDAMTLAKCLELFCAR